MKRYLCGVIALAMVLGLCSSCQKEVEGIIPENLNDSTDITDLIILDTTYNTGVDTFTTYRFKYDGNKRVIQETYTYYLLGVTGTSRIQSISLIKYQYNGTDTLPYKMSVETSSSGSNVSNYYLYYQNAWITKDSLSYGTPDGAYLSKEYHQKSPTRYLIYRKGGDNASIYFADTIMNCFVNSANGNIVNEIDSLRTGISSFQVVPHSFIYDTRPNPFRRVILPYPTPSPVAGNPLGINEIFFPTANNQVRRDYDGLVTTFNYTYGENGLPAIARVVEGVDKYKYIYRYTKL
jgi:hypothetical protein